MADAFQGNGLFDLCSSDSDDETKLKLIQWLQGNMLLHKNVKCTHCYREPSLIKACSRLDKYEWYCKCCHSTSSLRLGSIFELVPKVPIGDVLKFIFYWSENLFLKQIKLSAKAKTKMNFILREVVCLEFLKKKRMLQGTVAIDESLFCRRKYHRGKKSKHQTWVFGMVNIETGEPILIPVANRSARTLLLNIRRHIKRGSTIISDGWAAYSKLSHPRSPYLHLTVNHSQNFVNPATGAHTNHIEGTWSAAKRFLRSKSVRSRADLEGWLIVYMWRKWTNGDLFQSLLNAIKQQYKL